MSMPDWDAARSRLIEVPEPPERRRLVPRTKKSYKGLECRLCMARFSVQDILEGRYNLETFICSYCYADMQQKPHAVNCFGKPTMILPNGKREYGYNPEARDCATRCPDREICKRIVRPDLIAELSEAEDV